MREKANRGVSRGRTWIGIATAVSALAFASPSLAGSFQVNDPGDGPTPSPDCNVLNQTGTCTLRDAIALANANAGPNTIGFNIGGSGTQTISLSSPLPALTKPTTIDAATAWSWTEQAAECSGLTS